MKNRPSENFAHKQQNENIVQLSEQQKEFLNRAMSILNDNPEVGASIANDFSKNLDNILKNPETFQKLLDKIDADMHTKIEAISAQVKSGEIYTEDGKKQAKNIILSATQTKLDAVKREQEMIKN